MATAKAVPGPSGGRESGDNDQSFFVKKLPEINGSDAHATTGASGLGEGTPKVCLMRYDIFLILLAFI